MSLIKKIFIGYMVLYTLISFFAFLYILPSTDIVVITKTETQRGKDAIFQSWHKDSGPARDTYYISTRNKNNDIMMYRNENNSWYMKFNSADIQAQADSIIESQQKAVIVSYGFRSTVMNSFRNILKIKSVSDFTSSTFTFYTIIKWVGWGIWLTLIIIQIITPILFRNWRHSRLDKALGVK